MTRSFWKSKEWIAGIITGLCATIGSLALADTIGVTFLPLHFIVNGVDKTPDQNIFKNNGTSVPASLIYDNTTYIPIHFASDLLNTPIHWDGTTRTINIGQDSTVKYLSDLTPFYIDSEFKVVRSSDSSTTKNSYYSYMPTLSLAGRTYKDGFAIHYYPYSYNSNTSNSIKRIAFNINGQYKYLSFTYGFDDHSNSGMSGSSAYTSNSTTSSSPKREILLYGNGNLLWRGDISQGDLPYSETVSVAGISNLEIQTLGTNLTGDTVVDLVDPILKR
ncbi:NPCBM/NEW2 domain-containing protein [Fodinisporobacter ferrooxydans]|uniref:NPCBM/NEW2 domain-containing protein n=1 Tax=Fodinisporobacter ferrooxydans TaxID=2901836 RepID=A0ABY4CL37_9BACL|nr:NPCBM/NEW2 domain-containing protein [Alicyclobacillaceae bacterium MYW30-H2]